MNNTYSRPSAQDSGSENYQDLINRQFDEISKLLYKVALPSNSVKLVTWRRAMNGGRIYTSIMVRQESEITFYDLLDIATNYVGQNFVEFKYRGDDEDGSPIIFLDY